MNNYQELTKKQLSFFNSGKTKTLRSVSKR